MLTSRVNDLKTPLLGLAPWYSSADSFVKFQKGPVFILTVVTILDYAIFPANNDIVREVLGSVSLLLLMLTFTMFCIKRHLQKYLRKLSKENEPLADGLAMIKLACPIVCGTNDLCSIRK